MALLHRAGLSHEHGHALLGDSGGSRAGQSRPHMSSDCSRGQHPMPVPCPGYDRDDTVRCCALELVLCLVALACGGNNQEPIAPGGHVRETIDAWLLCHECTDGELD